MSAEWKPVNNSPIVEYKTFGQKVAHVVEYPAHNFKAFWDGIFLGSHATPEDARLACELLSGNHG